MRSRFLKSLVIGAVIAAALVAFEASYRPAALAATAAKSGGHQTVTSILVSGFVGAALAVALAAFVLATVLGAPRRARARRVAPQSWSTAAPRRRRRVGAGR